MQSEFTWKKFQFISEVQSALINNAINLTLDDDVKENRHLLSATAMLTMMDDAFYAADRIPDNLSAHAAACEFVGYTIENWRDDGARRPTWLVATE